MKMAGAIKSQDGMTLVELLVVTLLLAVLSGLLYGTLSGIIRAREQLIVKRQAYRSAANFISRLRSEFASAQAEALFQGGNGLPAQGSSAAEASTVAPIRYVAGANLRSGQYDSDSIRFTTASGAQEIYDAESNRGLIEVAYRIESENDASLGQNRTGVLIREEMPAGVKIDATLRRRRRIFPVCDKVISFNLRYSRDGKWLQEWKDASSRLPRAVDVELILADSNGDPVVIRTALPFGAPKLESAPVSIQIAEGQESPVPTPALGLPQPQASPSAP